MKITVFGVGYVGLVQGAVLAEVGHDVICIDIDAAKIDGLRQGHIPIYEPGLDVLVLENLRAGRLRFTTDTEGAIHHGSALFIAVGTPPDEDGAADLKYVLEVASAIAGAMNENKVIIGKSTVPVGTADIIHARVTEILASRDRRDLTFDVVSNPEFLKEGSAVADCMLPDRIIIGTRTPHAEALMREIYAPFNLGQEKIIVMDARSAELTKYVANCMLATKISFMNEMANIAESFGADIEMVRNGIGSDPRIGYHFIHAGAGYGGSCLPKDVKALARAASDAGFDAKILKAVEARNDDQKAILFKKLLQHYNNDLAGKTIAVWGLSFKPNTDDMRAAPSRVLLESIWEAGATVQAYDPEAMDEARRLYSGREALKLCDNKDAALAGADALAIITEWQAFKAPDFALIKSLLRNPVIFDGRNLFEPGKVREHGLVYYSIGRQ